MRLCVLAALISLSLAAPLESETPLERRAAVSAKGDAPYSQAAVTYIRAIQCPRGIGKARGGAVLLIHGTGSRGDESWPKSPYNLLLPSMGPTYDICWVNLPGRSLDDAQLSAEYVAYAIGWVSTRSKTAKTHIVGHSQGAGLNIQWALTFWPSTQKKITTFTGLSGDFRGTAIGQGVCAAQNVLGCQPSVWQQALGSVYGMAQNSKRDTRSGAQALVPTTSLLTYNDEVVIPEVGPTASSALPGAAVFALQDPAICGPGHYVEHIAMLFDSAAFGLAVATISASRPATVASFDKRYCQGFVSSPNLNLTNDAVIAELLAPGVAYLATTARRTPSEPALQPYVCARKYATVCGPAGFPASPLT